MNRFDVGGLEPSSEHSQRSILRLLAIICLTMVTTTVTFAQGTRGNIRGTVNDPNGAAVAGATIRLINIARNQEVRVVSANENGEFQIVEVDPATYEAVITAPGFAEARVSNITVEPNRSVQLDAVSLGVSGTSATVEVSAAQELVDRETPTLGTTVEARRVTGLPLNGRNILDLALLQPGVTQTQDAANPLIRANGQRGVENNFQLDGSNNNEIAVGGQTGVQPRPDAVQEFRLLTSNYEAEFGRNSGAVINVVTRSGTNDFHGNVRAFYRPTVLSAARYFDQNDPGDKPRAGTLDDFRRRFERKEFGGQFSGPLYLPNFGEGGPAVHLGKNKAFFFLDYEGRRQLIGATQQLANLPTAEEKAGIFSRRGTNASGNTPAAPPILLRDPANGLPFPIISGDPNAVGSNSIVRQQIPASRFSQIGQYYLGFIPASATGSATVSADQIENFDQFTMRIDPYVSNRQNFGFTFSRFNRAVVDPFPFFPTINGANVPGFGSLNLRKTYNAAVRHTFTFSPTVVNSFLAGYARNGQPSLAPQNATTPAEIGFSANFVASPGFAGPPFIFLDDRMLRLGNTFQGPQTRYASNYQIQDSLSWATGNHRFKFGFDGTHYRQDVSFLFINQGIISLGSPYGGNTTGNDLADLILGTIIGDIQFGANGERDFRQTGMSGFAQDTWHFNNELTFSLGLRYEYVGPLTDTQNRVAFYRPTAAARGISSTVLASGQLLDPFGRVIRVPAGRRAPVGILYPGDPDPDLGGTVPDSGVNRDLNNFAPRFGFAYSPRVEGGGFLRKLLGEQEMVIRGGFGVFYGAIVGDTALQQLSAPGYQGTNAYFPDAGGTLANPFAPDTYPDYFYDPTGGGNSLPVSPTIPNPFLATGAETVGVCTNTRNINTAPECRIANAGRAIDPFIRTPYTYQYNLTFERSFLRNYVASVSYVGNRGRKLYALEAVNSAYGIPGLLPYPDRVPVSERLPIAGQTAANGGVISNSTANINARRENTDIGTSLSMQVAAGNSWYNSLQVNLSRRYSDGLLFQVAYTFSKSITDTAGLDTNRGTLDRIDRRFGKALSIDDVPHRLVGSFVYDIPSERWFKNGFLSTLFGGWSIGGIYTAESGRVFFVNNLTNQTGVGAGGGINTFADLGDPFTPLDPRANQERAFNPTAYRAFTCPTPTLLTPNAFINCARRGTAGANQFRVPNGINNFDLIISKRTRLWSESTALELRFEAFNAFNHTQFTTLNTTLPAIGSDANLSSFGKFTAARESRVIQLGMRFSF